MAHKMYSYSLANFQSHFPEFFVICLNHTIGWRLASNGLAWGLTIIPVKQNINKTCLPLIFMIGTWNSNTPDVLQSLVCPALCYLLPNTLLFSEITVKLVSVLQAPPCFQDWMWKHSYSQVHTLIYNLWSFHFYEAIASAILTSTKTILLRLKANHFPLWDSCLSPSLGRE